MYSSWKDIQKLSSDGLSCDLCDEDSESLWAVYCGPDRYAVYCEYHRDLYKSGWLDLVILVEEAVDGR